MRRHTTAQTYDDNLDKIKKLDTEIKQLKQGLNTFKKQLPMSLAEERIYNEISNILDEGENNEKNFTDSFKNAITKLEDDQGNLNLEKQMQNTLKSIEEKQGKLQKAMKEIRELNIVIKKTKEFNDKSINKGDQFFISICKKGKHSFIIAGVMEYDQPQILMRVGKCFTHQESKSWLKSNAAMVFTKARAVLKSEPIDRIGEISYQAYSINYNQYLELIKLVGGAQPDNLTCSVVKIDYEPSKDNLLNIPFDTDAAYVISIVDGQEKLFYVNKASFSLTEIEDKSQILKNEEIFTNDRLNEPRILSDAKLQAIATISGYNHNNETVVKAFLPKNPSNTEQINLEYMAITKSNGNRQDEAKTQIIERSKELKITNTCRSAAIDLVQYTQGSKPSVSNIFFKNLPIKTRINFFHGSEGYVSENPFLKLYTFVCASTSCSVSISPVTTIFSNP